MLLDLLQRVMAEAGLRTVECCELPRQSQVSNTSFVLAAIKEAKQDFLDFTARQQQAVSVQQEAIAKLQQLKACKVAFCRKLVRGCSQLYLDYGYTKLGGAIEGLALVSLTPFGLSLPASMQQAKRIVLNQPSSTAQQQNQEQDFITKIEKHKQSMLDRECFLLLRQSLEENGFTLFCQEPGCSFSFYLNSTMQTVRLAEAAQDEAFSLACGIRFCDYALGVVNQKR